jgi:hypothetical protein
VSFTIGLLLIGLVTSLIVLVLLVGLVLLIFIILIPTLKGTISNEVTILTTIVSCSLSLGFELVLSF